MFAPDPPSIFRSLLQQYLFYGLLEGARHLFDTMAVTDIETHFYNTRH